MLNVLLGPHDADTVEVRQHGQRAEEGQDAEADAGGTGGGEGGGFHAQIVTGLDCRVKGIRGRRRGFSPPPADTTRPTAATNSGRNPAPPAHLPRPPRQPAPPRRRPAHGPYP